MPETSEPAPTARGRVFGGTVAIVAIVALSLLAGVLALALMNKEYVVALDTEGRIDISVKSGTTLRDILLKSLEADRAAVEEILTARDYYHYADPDLAHALETLSAEDPADAPAVAALRQLLRDQRGPFVMPDTLVGFDAKLIEAFGNLETKLQETRQTSDLLIGLWRQSLEYKGIFRTRLFDATVRRLPASSGGGARLILIHGCPGSDFNGSEIMLRTPDLVGSVSGIIGTSELHRCDESDQKLAELFSRETASFGLDADSYQKLFSPGDPTAALEPELSARFQFLPTGSTTVLQSHFGG